MPALPSLNSSSKNESRALADKIYGGALPFQRKTDTCSSISPFLGSGAKEAIHGQRQRVFADCHLYHRRLLAARRGCHGEAAPRMLFMASASAFLLIAIYIIGIYWLSGAAATGKPR